MITNNYKAQKCLEYLLNLIQYETLGHVRFHTVVDKHNRIGVEVKQHNTDFANTTLLFDLGRLFAEYMEMEEIPQWSTSFSKPEEWKYRNENGVRHLLKRLHHVNLSKNRLVLYWDIYMEDIDE